MNNPTILLTGGAGYIGSHTAFLLAQQGYRVVIVDRLMHQQTFNPPWATAIINADFADNEVLNHIFTTYKITAVMHFAAFIDVGESVSNPQVYYDNNVIKTLALLQAMRSHNVSNFIFSSSCAVYGIPQVLPLAEDHPKNPISPYGKTKLMAEMILQDFNTAYGINFVALRYFNAAGALPEEKLGEVHIPETHLIPLLIQAALYKKPFTIFGTDHPTKDGTCVRDFLHVLDIAQAHVLALNHLQQQRPSDFFNLGTGHGFSVHEMLKATETLLGLPIKTVYAKARAGDPPLLIADPTRAHTILNWHPTHSRLDNIIKTAAAFSKLMSC